MGGTLIVPALLRRGLPALVALVAATSLLASTAFAFTLQNSGFTATTYSSPYPLDATGRGARATAWDGNVLWAVDYADGGLYRADAGGAPGPAVSLSPTRVAVIAGGLNGLAVGLDGTLYATLVDTGSVIKIDKTTHAVTTIASGSISPRSVATDPTSGDLIVTGAAKVWRIASPASATPIVSIYTALPGNAGSRAIAIGPDGTMFVVNDYGQIFSIESTAIAATHSGTAIASPIGSPVANMVGLAVVTDGVDNVAQFLMVSTSTGAVYKTPGTSGASGNTILVLDGAGAGDQLSLGPDRCAYASMDGTVLRVADATGGCQLSLAGVIPPALTISDTTGQPERATGAASLSAHLTNASTLGGHTVTFTISGLNNLSLTATTDASGNAQVSYTSATAGSDSVVATTSADGFSVTSNTLAITWLPLPDLSAPLISFNYAVPAGGDTSMSFACDTTKTSASFAAGVLPQVLCGWFTKAPTIHFTVTATGTSGLGALSGCGDYTLTTQPGPQGQAQTCRAYNGDTLASATLSIVIDAVLSPPSVVASAAANGAPYSAGALTRGPVTVHFDCSASPIQTALACPVDQIFTGTGLYDAVGTATDIAGQTTTLHFQPIDIDATPPTITVAPVGYAYGSWTNADVHLVFSCADNVAVASCPGAVTVTATSAGITGTATDTVGNTASVMSGAINIDKTPPSILATATTADGATYLAGTPTNQDVTVHFACATDGAPVNACGPDVSYTAAGTTMTTSGTATDAAGNSAIASFGAVVIDRTLPSIAAVVTVNGASYDGSWTQGPVLVHFACTDETALASCSADRTLTADQNSAVTGIAADVAGNTNTATTMPIRIDRTPPTTAATLTGTLSGPGTYLFTASVGLASVDAGSGVLSISYAIDGSPAQVAAGASATFVVNTEGAHSVVFHAVDNAGNVESDHTITFSIIFRQHTSLAITSPSFLATGAQAAARLMNTDAGVPVAGETVSFAANGVTRTAVTDAAGIARVDPGLASGAYTLTATYAGTPHYFPSADQQQLIVYAPTRFVVWSANASVGSLVQFYGDHWAAQIGDRAIRRLLSDFKGYASATTSTSWSGRTGDSVKPPHTVPEYIGVLLTSSASRSKDAVGGNVIGIAVLRVTADHGDDRGRDASVSRLYDGKLGDEGFGRVLGRISP